tara:strand:+ start:70 stop:624 length:555 start_codon:yes stop_codon:yes gene_type:complete
MSSQTTRVIKSDSNSGNHNHHHHHHHDNDSFGDFQANVGRASAKASVVGAWIFAVILGIIGIVLAIFAFIPRYKDEDCQDELSDAKKSLSNCNEARKSAPVVPNQSVVTRSCDDEKDKVASLTKSCKKTRNYLLLLGLLLIPIGVLIVWGAKAWDHRVQSSRSAAQFGGALTEASIVSDMLQRR